MSMLFIATWCLQPIPGEYDVAIRQAQEAVKAALADGHKCVRGRKGDRTRGVEAGGEVCVDAGRRRRWEGQGWEVGR